MNKHVDAFLEYYKRNPEPLPAHKKQAKPPEPSLDREDLADKLYLVFETIKQHTDVPDFVLEDLLDVIEHLKPGYLVEAKD